MTDIENNVNSLKENYEHFTADVASFTEKGNKAAATRARKALLDISKLCKDIRKQIQEIKNSSQA
jgi:archaellum component FlaC